MLKQILVPSKENSTVSIPAEFYGMEVDNVKLEAYNNLLKFRGTLKRDIDYKTERNNYLDEKYGSVN